MKKYIVIYNKNSRGKTYSKNDLEKIFSSHDLDTKIFITSEISDVDKIIKNYKNSKDYVYCAIGSDGTLNSLVNSLLSNNIDNPDYKKIIDKLHKQLIIEKNKTKDFELEIPQIS